MKKRVVSIIYILTFICSMFAFSYTDVYAFSNEVEKIDGSYLTTEDSSKGSTEINSNTRGIHLMDGECSITKAGRGKIYVYSSTTANHEVDYVATIIYIDRYNEATKKWGQIDYWMVEDHNTYYVATSKMLSVDGGYYYRVHADHFAGMDADYPYEEATSATDGIWID